jgi:secernin
MHGAFESAGSQISSLSAEGCEHWFIEQPFPCQQEYEKKSFTKDASWSFLDSNTDNRYAESRE